MRAIGFRERTFEKQVGVERYRWLEALGNAGLDDKNVRLLDEKAGLAALLEIAQAAEREKRRVIFFCACHSLADECHRHLAAQKLIAKAKKEKLNVQIVEWPGGALPDEVQDLVVSPEVFKAVAKGQAAITLDAPDIAGMASLPWCSPLRLKSADGKQSRLILSGALRVKAGGAWALLVLDADAETWRERALAMREQYRVEMSAS